MKPAEALSGVVAACLLVFLGCSKSEQQQPPGSSVQMIDASKLRPAFSSSSPEAQASVGTVIRSIQASDFMTALAELDKLSNTPGITEQQKKIVNDVIEQVKKKVTPTAGPPSP